MRICSRQKGFTLIELMITLGILAIIMGLAAPSFTKMIRDNRVQTASAGFMSAFSLARAEAIRRGRDVSICAVDDPGANPLVCGATWPTGWAIFVDANNDGVIQAGEEYRVGNPMPNLVVAGPATLVTFNSRGQPAVAGTGNYFFDSVGCTSGVDKQISINLGTVGRMNAAEGFCP